jgi:hypothetical protein
MNVRRKDEATGRKVSRRWLLRSTASLTAGAAAAATITFAPAEPAVEPTVPPDHDPETGEIFDRDRHHHWDTI